MDAQKVISDAFAAVKLAQDAQAIGREAIRQRDILLDTLRECVAYFAARTDVVDGDYGAQEANEEMRMAQRIDEAISKCGF